MRRLMFIATSLRRAPSTLSCDSITWRSRPANPKNVGQRDFDALFIRQIDSGDTSQNAPPCLTLTLFVARVLADDAHDALAPDNLAVLANPRNRCFHFHDRPPPGAICTGR